MALTWRFDRALAAGLLLSLAAHVTLLALLGRLPVAAALAPSDFNVSETTADREERLRLGIERSEALTVNWLGFEDPTEHRARPSEVEQPALTRSEPGKSEIFETQTSSEATAAPAPAGPIADREPQPSDGGEPIDVAVLLESLRPVVEQVIAAANEAMAAGAAQQMDPPSPSPPASGDPGIHSESEAAPTAITGTLDVRPGRTAVAEGLRIKTVRPRWSTVTQMTAFPRNPVVRVKFGRDGHVKTAAFEPGQTTGYSGVDGPLLDAIYAWTADGEALARLPASDPDAGLTITLRVLLR